MRSNTSKSLLIKSGLAATVLLLASGASVAQQQINLTAGPATAPLPDGSAVPMWGYSCDATQVSGSTATCAALNPAVTTATPGVWSPVVITIPYTVDGSGNSNTTLQINLTNALSFATTSGTNTLPTSLVIVGQLGGGLGDTTQRTSTVSPVHGQDATTWFSVVPGTTNTPPPQQNRIQSFATEAPYGAQTSLTWSGLRPGTYLIESGTHPSIQGPMGLFGMLVVTTAASGTTAGTAYPNVTYNAEVPLLLSEIDPIQNNTVSSAVHTVGFSETTVWSGLPGGCGNPASPTYLTCYPPAVNYTPLYYLINGVAFSRSAASASLVAPLSSITTLTGNVLVRLVIAGMLMNVPSIVGAATTPLFNPGGAAGVQTPGLSLIAEDGNPLPGVSRVQSEVFMAAGKTYDVMINAPSTGASALPVYDRELSLSSNAVARDGGMLAYLNLNSAALPTAASLGAAVAVADTYNSLLAGKTFTVSDPAKGVIANDTNVYGVALDATKMATNGTVTLNPNGTFTYVPTGTATTDSFGYCANGTTQTSTTPICTTVTLGAATLEAASGITCAASAYSATTSTTLSIKPPGILAACTDGAGYPLTVNAASVTALAPGGSVSVDANGGFNATVAAAGTYTFTFLAQNSQGTVGAAASRATVTLTFPAATGVKINLVDGFTKTAMTDGDFGTGDFRWIIEEDRTFYINPACTSNPPAAGCPTFGSGQVPTFGTNFHTSYMPVVAAGCTGDLSCESGQTLLGAGAVCDVGNGVCRTTATRQASLDPGDDLGK